MRERGVHSCKEKEDVAMRLVIKFIMLYMFYRIVVRSTDNLVWNAIVNNDGTP